MASKVGLLRSRVALCAAAALLTASCSSSESSGDTSDVPARAVALNVTIGTTDGPTVATATLSVDAAGVAVGTGFLADPATAAAAAAIVASVEGRTRLVDGELAGQACTEIYGGPDIATVTGSIGDTAIDTTFHRANGCGIADWELLQALLGPPRWDTDSPSSSTTDVPTTTNPSSTSATSNNPDSTTETTTVPTISTQPEAPWAPMPANAAGGELTRFVDSARELHDGLQPLIREASALPVGEMSPPAVAQHAAGARDQFFDLPTMIPVGLQPDVRAAAIDVVFALGREMAPFLFAPGWESDGWDMWSSGIEDARVDVPPTVARLAERAAAHPDLAATNPVGADTAAFQGGLHVLVVRGFGHQNFTTQPPWSVRWLGGLPADPADTICSLGGRPLIDGDFVDQQGGCAMLYYDSSDAATHDAELAAWLLDPTVPPAFQGEIITIRWLNGEWIAEGSAE